LKEVNAALRFVFLILCAVSVRGQENDWLIVPGERLGPIRSDITRAGLDRLLGKARVHDQPVDSGEGPEPATVVFSEMRGAALAIFWRDLRTISNVMICYRPEDSPCKWYAEGGVSLGTSLERLETLNGRAFQIAPWGSEGGGSVSWRGGRLAGVLGDGVNNSLWLTLDFRSPPEGYTPQQHRLLDEIDALKRDPLSSDLVVRQLHLTVGRMWLNCTVMIGR
jgi:hypothetical protein